MITNYYRPQTLEEALRLLSQPDTRPLGGGTILLKQKDISFSVVDLQSTGLGTLRKSGDSLEIGATVSLQMLLDSPFVPKALKMALELEAPLNLRTMGTVAGALVTCTGGSPFSTAMLALDAKCVLMGDQQSMMRLGDLLPLREELLSQKLITRIDIPQEIKMGFEAVARTPADKPIVCAALAVWPSGRTRLALGGWGMTPTLAMDGNTPDGLEESARNAFSDATDDWASAEYRQELAGILAKRCLAEVQNP
jgi:putative selenate reductase FAD-binding subunit